MPFDESVLSKGERRKLNALRKAVGPDLGSQVFEKWLSRQPNTSCVSDPTAVKLRAAMVPFEKDASFRLGNKGYTVRRARGRGASGFIVTKNGA